MDKYQGRRRGMNWETGIDILYTAAAAAAAAKSL